MHIKRFGIRLVRLKEEHIETVRHWRNAQEIRSFMEFQDYITPEMQQKWFHSLDKLCDFYFVIESQEEPVGLIHTSGIEWKKKSGHTGLFIWKKELQGSQVPVLASLSMVDFFFNYCTLEKLFAKVNAENPVAIKYNEQLGFKPSANAGGKRAFRQYELCKHNYFDCTSRLHHMAESISGGAYEIVIDNDLFESLQALHVLNKAYTGGFVTIV